MCLGRLCANMWGEPRPAQADSWQQSAETAEYAEPMTWTGYEQAACAAARRQFKLTTTAVLLHAFWYVGTIVSQW